MNKIFLVLAILAFQQTFSQNQQYLIKPTNINNSTSNFGLSFCADGFVVFSSLTKEEVTKKKKKKRKKNNLKNSLDFFVGYADEQGNIINVRELGKGINSFSDEIDIAFSPNCKTVYFTKSTSADGSKDHLELYKADVVTIGYWKNIMKLSFNSDSYSVTNPFVSSDGKELYFSSNMPSSKGGFDIYKVAISGNNKFGEPINLEEINTKGDEVTPFVTSEKIYFSSNGHQGMGKLDVFVADLNNLSAITNLHAPINSDGNDYYFKEKNNSNIGYFTSDRTSVSGNDNIYFFKDINIKTESNSEEEFPLPDIEIKELETKKDVAVKKEKDPKFELRKKQLLTAKKEAIVSNSEINIQKQEKVTTLNSEENTTQIIKTETVLSSEEHPTKRTEIASKNSFIISDDFERCQTLFDNLNNIYFDFDKYNLTFQAKRELEQVIQIMQRCPKIIVLASSHTDSRAGYEYNMELSRKRANTVMNYIIRNGNFSEDRIRSIGFGEARLLNECADGVKCTERQHQINRRTEFEILNY